MCTGTSQENFPGASSRVAGFYFLALGPVLSRKQFLPIRLRGSKSGLRTSRRMDLRVFGVYSQEPPQFFCGREKVLMWGLCLPKSNGLHWEHVIRAVSCKEISSAPTSLHSPPGAPGLGFPESLGMVQALRLSRRGLRGYFENWYIPRTFPRGRG